MNSTTAPNAIGPDDVVVARADERLVHAYDQIARADEQLARLNEQLARLESEAKHHPSAVVGPRPSRGRRALRGVIGLLLAAGIFAFAFVSQSSYGEAAKSTVARWAPQLILRRPGWKNPRSPRSRAHLAFSWPRRPRCFRNRYLRLRRPRRTSRRQPPRQRPSWRSCSRRWRAISQTWSRGSCSSRRTRNKRPATMRRPPRRLKASQEQMTRLIAKLSEHNKVSEQNLRPRTSAPPLPPIAAPKPVPVRPVAASQSAAAGPNAVAARRRPVVVNGRPSFARS